MSAHARPTTLRLFFALWPNAPARKALAQLAFEIARDGQGRAPREPNLHLTLAFLGDVTADRLTSLEAAGAHAAKSAQAFRLALERLGGTAYGIAWLAPAERLEPLHLLHAALDEALAAAGVAREQRMFRPHVTLARDCVRSVHRGRVAPIGWNVDRVSLVASTPASGGSHYRDVGSWTLGAAPDPLPPSAGAEDVRLPTGSRGPRAR